MGLDCSYDAFHGSYGSFHRFRQAVCYVIGGSYPPHNKTNYFVWEKDQVIDEHNWYCGYGYSIESHPGLFLFLNHSDCDGELSPEECRLVANDLEPLIIRLRDLGLGSGHIKERGGYAQVCQTFVDGCRKAAQNNDSLLFG